MGYYEDVQEAAEAIGNRLVKPPSIGVVLGSGLGSFVESLQESIALPYESLPHWPISRVSGHDNRLAVGKLRGRTILALAGRCHLYEGHDPATVTFSIRVLGLLGVRVVILTNAAGGIRADLVPGTLMVVDDHINLTGSNPLGGANDDRFGPRFPDMTEVYAPRLRAIADDAARATRVAVGHGVYAAVAGPSYETPAEIRYLRTVGADAVGMSTVPEALVARHMDLEVLGLSCISNVAAGARPGRLDHADLVEVTRRTRRPFAALLEEIVGRL